jgi:hypothetical protein
VNLPVGWVISNRPAHPELISEVIFVAAKDSVAAARSRKIRRTLFGSNHEALRQTVRTFVTNVIVPGNDEWIAAGLRCLSGDIQ